MARKAAASARLRPPATRSARAAPRPTARQEPTCHKRLISLSSDRFQP